VNYCLNDTNLVTSGIGRTPSLTEDAWRGTASTSTAGGWSASAGNERPQGTSLSVVGTIALLLFGGVNAAFADGPRGNGTNWDNILRASR
jgi:hypothetical protein